MNPPVRISHLLASTLVGLAFTIGGTGIACADDGNPSGPYVAVSLGKFDVTIDDLAGVDDTLEEIDTDDSAWKAAFGWRFNPFLSLEVDYVDLGTPNGDFEASGTAGDYELDMSGVAGYVIGTLPIWILELSGKVGYYFHDVNVQVDRHNVGSSNGDVFNSDSSGEALVYGAGIGFTFFDHLNAKVEYELMEIDELDDAHVLWLTAGWRF